MTSRAPRAEVAIVPDGRFCMTWERADEIASLARRFLL
jgi:hypothetical protein